jgi:hypothetical protein
MSLVYSQLLSFLILSFHLSSDVTDGIALFVLIVFLNSHSVYHCQDAFHRN